MVRSIAVAVGALLTATAAQAAEPVPTFTVHAADLDLSRPRDVTTLDRRISAAIEQVCPAGPATGLLVSASTLRCRAVARQSASAQRDALVATRTADRRLASR